MVEKTVTGTGILLSKDGKEFVGSADYTVWMRTEDEFSEPTDWGGEMDTIGRIRTGEYIFELDPNDGRQGDIKLQSGKMKTVNGFKTFHYVFEGIGLLVCEGSTPVID